MEGEKELVTVPSAMSNEFVLFFLFDLLRASLRTPQNRKSMTLHWGEGGWLKLRTMFSLVKDIVT